jgi:hypothetical protein
VRGQAVAVGLRHRGDEARSVPDLLEVRHAEEDPPVPTLSELVQLDETRLEFGSLLQIFALDPRNRILDVRELRRDGLTLRGDLRQLLGEQLALDFELAQIADERS